jgi:hypothetical protein
LHWGLGVVWNSGDGVFDRYQSTGDVIRMISKFGSFSFSPALVKYSMGNTVGGACNYSAGTCNSLEGSGAVADYSLMLKFENPDEDFEGGVNYIKRIGGSAQDNYLRYGYAVGGAQTAAAMNFNTWDIYGRKNFGKVSLGAEIPIVSGDLGGVGYSTFAAAVEAGWKPNDTWDASLRVGHAPGQPSIATTTPDTFKAFYFNPAYKLGLIMFNYQPANFAGVQSNNNATTAATGTQLASPYDNPIVNANYLSVMGGFRTQRWHFHGAFTFATALEAADAGLNFYNTNQRTFFTNGTGSSQSKALGWEMDYGTTFHWDENFQVNLDFGWYFPGAYYQFSNVAGIPNRTDSVPSRPE